MASKADIVIKAASSAAPDHARDSRARAWRFVFDCYAKKKAAGVPSTNGSDGTEIKEDSANEPIIPD